MQEKATIFAVLTILITVLHQGLSTPAIGFSASLSRDTHLGDNHAIKYDKVLTNYGYGYNKWSGHFKAPRKGLYMFSCTVMAYSGDNISVAMVKNHHVMMYVYSDYSAYDTGAASVVLAMKRGDRVWIRRNGHGRYLHGVYNIFSGFLISENI
uniref:C1q domain-containing protein n=1 Tax=Magallana gigas TaxID=29159 RepID=A0A8W8MM93_MAGGI